MRGDSGDEPQGHHPLDPSRFEPLGETRAFRHIRVDTKAELDQILPALVGAGVMGYVGDEDPSTPGTGPWYYCNGVGWYSMGAGGPLFGHDYIIDYNWAAKVAAGQGVEGQEIGTLTGFSTRVYSDLAPAIAHAQTEGLAGRVNKSFFIVPGTVSYFTASAHYSEAGYWNFESTLFAESVAPQARIAFDYTGYLDYVRFSFRNIRLGDSTFSMSGGNQLRLQDCDTEVITFYDRIHVTNCVCGQLLMEGNFGDFAFISNSFISVLVMKEVGLLSVQGSRVDKLWVEQVENRLIVNGSQIGASNADPPVKIGRPGIGITHGPIILTGNSIVRRNFMGERDAIYIDGSSNNFEDLKVCDNVFEEVGGATWGNPDHLIHLHGGTIQRATILGNHWGRYPLVAIKTDVDGTWVDVEIAHNIPNTVGLELPGPVDDRARGILYAAGGLNLGYNTFSVRFDNIIVDISGSSIVLPPSQTSYVEVDSSGTVSSNTTGYTLTRIPLGRVTTDGSSITLIVEEGVHLDQQLTGAVAYIPFGSEPIRGETYLP